MANLGILNNTSIPMPILLNAIQFSETGHLTPERARFAVSPAGAYGNMQFLKKNLHDMGYGMPRNIPMSDIYDPEKARKLAGQYVDGYSKHHNFETPLMKLVAYNMGATAAENWAKSGGRIEDLPTETQEYINRAAGYLSSQSAPDNEENVMDVNDPYNIMRELGYNEIDIAAAKRKGVDPRFFGIKDGFNNGVLAQTPDQVGGDTAMRDGAGVLNNVRDITPAVRTRETPWLDMAIRMNNANANVNAESDPSLISQANAGTLTPSGNQSEFIRTEFPPEPKLVSATGQRRNAAAMALNPQIDLNEMLIRTGLAGVSASSQGALPALGAMGKMYGDIMDANRSNALKAFDSSGSSSSNKDAEFLGKMDETLFDMQRAKQYLSQGGVTGLFDATIGAGWDKLVGNKQQTARMLLEKLRVDDTLLRIAQTKGAISNKEMDLFLAPTPSVYDQESTWLQWIDDRERAINRIKSRLNGGLVVDPSQQATSSQVAQFGSGVSPQLQADIDKYASK